MLIRTAKDLGLLIRNRRKALSLDQKGLAAQVGVSRQWVIEVEKGKPRAELELVLRTFRVLDITLDAKPRGKPSGGAPAIDLDRLIDRNRGKE